MIGQPNKDGSARRCENPDVRLFPGCDPRGVLTRALAAGAADWATRPDALVFGWMLALAPGVDCREAAAGVLAVAGASGDRTWTEAQKALLAAIRAVEAGVSPQERV